MFGARKRFHPEVRDSLTPEGSSQSSAMRRPVMYPTSHVRYIAQSVCVRARSTNVVALAKFENRASVKTAETAKRSNRPHAPR